MEYLITGEEESPQGKGSLGPEIRLLIQNLQQLDEEDRKMICSIAQLYKNHQKK
jgi:hypothetical protein